MWCFKCFTLQDVWSAVFLFYFLLQRINHAGQGKLRRHGVVACEGYSLSDTTALGEAIFPIEATKQSELAPTEMEWNSYSDDFSVLQRSAHMKNDPNPLPFQCLGWSRLKGTLNSLPCTCMFLCILHAGSSLAIAICFFAIKLLRSHKMERRRNGFGFHPLILRFGVAPSSGLIGATWG